MTTSGGPAKQAELLTRIQGYRDAMVELTVQLIAIPRKTLPEIVTKLKAEVEERATAYRIAPDSLRRSILMMGGQCASGTNFNVVPDTCTFTVDRRINLEEDFKPKNSGFCLYSTMPAKRESSSKSKPSKKEFPPGFPSTALWDEHSR